MRSIFYLMLFSLGLLFFSCEKDDSNLENNEFQYMYLLSAHSWKLSSVPISFSESRFNNDLTSGFNRARIAWYKIDPLFLRNNTLTPGHIIADVEQQSNHFVREIYESELFPTKELEIEENSAIQVLNIAYYPQERGPYNFDTYSSDYSAGINSEGKLNNPDIRWAGVQREIPFTAIAFDTLDFWLMNPFVYNQNIEGDLYIDLGDISEDVLKDSRISFEEGLPTFDFSVGVDTTVWGRISLNEPTGYFSTVNEMQDVGLDGLSDEDEVSFFQDYLDKIDEIIIDINKREEIFKDPSNDNYHYYKGEDYDAIKLSILDRYKRYNGVCGNSSGSLTQIVTKTPDNEDLNLDKILQTTNNYVEYKISVRNIDFNEGQNFIVEKRFGHNVDLPNGEQDAEIAWFHFKIPLNQYANSYGLGTFNGTARSMRIYLTGFSEEVVLRFATLNLVGKIN